MYNNAIITDPVSPAATTLVALLRERATSLPDQLAYTFLREGDGVELRITYAELDEKARAIAAHLQALHLTGERAVLLYQPGLEFVAAFSVVSTRAWWRCRCSRRAATPPWTACIKSAWTPAPR